MFGIFKKKLDGTGLKWAFIYWASRFALDNPSWELHDLRDSFQDYLDGGNFKLTAQQNHEVRGAMLEYCMNSGLRTLLKECRKTDGSIDEKLVEKVVETLNRGGVYFM